MCVHPSRDGSPPADEERNNAIICRESYVLARTSSLPLASLFVGTAGSRYRPGCRMADGELALPGNVLINYRPDLLADLYHTSAQLAQIGDACELLLAAWAPLCHPLVLVTHPSCSSP